MAPEPVYQDKPKEGLFVIAITREFHGGCGLLLNIRAREKAAHAKNAAYLQGWFQRSRNLTNGWPPQEAKNTLIKTCLHYDRVRYSSLDQPLAARCNEMGAGVIQPAMLAKLTT